MLGDYFKQGSFLIDQDASPEEIKRKREAVKKILDGSGKARYIGEGIGDLVKGAAAGMLGRKLDQLEKDRRESGAGMLGDVTGVDLFGGSGSTRGGNIFGSPPSYTSFNPQPQAPVLPDSMGTGADPALAFGASTGPDPRDNPAAFLSMSAAPSQPQPQPPAGDMLSGGVGVPSVAGGQGGDMIQGGQRMPHRGGNTPLDFGAGQAGGAPSGLTPKQALAYKTALEIGHPNPALFLAQIEQESGWRDDVWNGQTRSTAGAIGPGQLMPGTARELGVDPYDIGQNLRGAATYSKQMMEQFGDPKLALAAYNAGPGRVRESGGIPNIAETRDYVERITGNMSNYERMLAGQGSQAGQGSLNHQFDERVTPDLNNILGTVGDSMGVEVRVASGHRGAGGSGRHNGFASDAALYHNGRRLSVTNPEDLPIIQEFTRRFSAYAQAQGHTPSAGWADPSKGNLYMGGNTGHFDIAFSQPAFGRDPLQTQYWGNNSKREGAPDWLRQAITNPGEWTPGVNPSISTKGGDTSLAGGGGNDMLAPRSGLDRKPVGPSPTLRFGQAAQPQQRPQQAPAQAPQQRPGEDPTIARLRAMPLQELAAITQRPDYHYAPAWQRQVVEGLIAERVQGPPQPDWKFMDLNGDGVQELVDMNNPQAGSRPIPGVGPGQSGADSPDVQSAQMLPDMSGVVMPMKDGSVTVRTAGGEILQGDAAMDFVRQANENYTNQQRSIYTARRAGTLEADVDLGGEAAASVEAGKNAQTAGMAALESVSAARANIPKLQRVIELVDSGANVGTIASQLPALDDATKELRNMRNQLGLDVVGSVTFGALSEGELNLALTTALPDNLSGPALKQWVTAKMAAQSKLANYYEEQARFLLQPGNEIIDWMDYQRSRQGGTPQPQGGNSPSNNPQPAPAQSFDAFASDPSVQAAAAKYGVTVEEMWAVSQNQNGSR